MLKNKKSTSKAYHLPYTKFQGYMKENGITLKDLGDLLGGLSVQTISCKNHGKSDYKMGEINKICDYYKISADIFRTKAK